MAGCVYDSARACHCFTLRIRSCTLDDRIATYDGGSRLSSSRQHAAIALVSCAILVFEIAATRILSVVHWYHWAFLCVSLAMLGLGAPGVWFTFARRPERFLSPLLLLSAALLPLSIVAIVKVGGQLPSHAILFSMMCLLLPMLCMGGAVCLLLMRAQGERIARMYGFDLVGACIGALAVIPLMHTVPTPSLVGALGLLPLAAHVCLKGRVSKVALALCIALLALLAWREPFILRYSKSYQERGYITPIYEKWTPTARLTFFDSVFWVSNKEAGFAWGRGTRARPVSIEQYWIEQDGSAGTPITRFDGDLSKLEYLLDDVTAVGYQLRLPQSVAIVGAGGGRDILTARLMSARHIDAIELNPHIIKALSTRFRDFCGDVYHQPGVEAIAGEGRSTLTRSARAYDIIQISLIDSWAATAAGAFALSENNLYTVEAFRLYFRRLTPTGMISTSRWLGISFETPRLVLLVQQALREEGIANPNAHLIVVQGRTVGTVLVSRSPFSAAEIGRLSQIAAQRGFTVLFPTSAATPLDSTVTAVMHGGPSAFAAAGLRLDPPRDDRPFFFQVVPPFQRLDKAFAKGHGINNEAVYTLQVLMIVMSILTLALFWLPFVLVRRMRPATGQWRGSLFFCCIGIAFMLLEIPCMQRFVLYLGHPSYSITVVLASLLLGGALGSTVSARLGLTRVQRYGLVLPALIAVLNLALSGLFAASLGLPLWQRVLLSVVTLLPLAFCMGLFFPLGMVRFGDRSKAWYWAMNGAAGVLASVASVALSMELGFRAVLWLAVAFYAGACWLLRGKPVT